MKTRGRPASILGVLAAVGVLSVIGAVIYFGIASAALTQKAVTVTTAADFAKGTLVDTVVTNVSGGEVRLRGGAVDWIPGNFFYRRPIGVTENSGGALSEYQVLVTLTPATFDYLKCQTDGDDIRFGDINGNVLDYYTEAWNYNGTSTFWVKVPTLGASGTATIYVYYGNAGASAYSNLASTFSYSSPRVVGYVVSDRTASTGLNVISLAAGNQITDGTSTLALNDQGIGSLPSSELTMGTPISATGLFQADGAGTGTDTISPISWADTEFIYNIQRRSNTSSTFYLVSPFGPSSVTIYVYPIGGGAGSANGPYSIDSSGSAISLNLGQARTVRITSALPILAQHLFGAAGVMEDSFLLYPVSSDYLYGVPSTQILVANGDAAEKAWTYVNSDGDVYSSTLGGNGSVNISLGTTGAFRYGALPAFRVNSDANAIGVNQRYDYNRYDCVPFLPESEMGTKFGAANNVGYVAMATPNVSTSATFSGPSQSLIQTGGARTDVNKIGFNTGNSTQYDTAGWKIETTTPVYAYYDKRIGTSYEETTLWSYKQMRQYIYPPPAVGTPGAEEQGVVTNGSYSSPGVTTPGSGIIDLIWNGGWGTNGGGNAFESQVEVPAGGSITFKARSSATGGSDDADWSAWTTLGTQTATGTFAVLPAAFAAVPAGSNRFVQIKADFASNGVTSPVMNDYTVWYKADEDPPVNPTAVNGYRDSSETDLIVSGTWYNLFTPHFKWTGAVDPDSGIKGYYVYFGDQANAIPSVSGVFQAGDTYTADITQADSGRTFYLRIQAVDNAGNVYTNADISTYTYFTYRFDCTKPANPAFVRVTPAGWSTIDNFDFNWPAGTDTGGIYGNSGIAGYRYKRAGDVAWSSTSALAVLSQTSYQNGTNLFYVKSIDIAGNEADGQAQAEYFFNADAPSAPQNPIATPPDNTTNSFSFEWDPPLSYNDGIKGYYYSINSSPSLTNSTYIATPSPPAHVLIPAFAAATQQGQNSFHVVAIDTSDNINWGNESITYFYCTTTAPGIPLNIAITDASNRDTNDWRLTLTWQAPLYPGPDFAGYKVYRSDDGGPFVLIATTTGTGYLDTGLDNTVAYTYQVTAYDSAANEGGESSEVTAIPTGRYLHPPLLINGPAVTPSGTRATVTWTTDRVCDSFVQYSKTPSVFDQSQGQIDSVTGHTVAMANLESGTTYYFRAVWRDIDGNIGYSPSASFMTDVAGAVTAVEVSDLSLGSAVITWTTTIPTTTRVVYGTTNNYGDTAEDTSGSMTTTHTMRLTGLAHSTLYHFKVMGTDKEGNLVQGEDNMFMTIRFPIISDVRLQTTQGDEGAIVTVFWNTNIPTTSGVEYFPALGGQSKETGSFKMLLEHSIAINDLADATDYQLYAKSSDEVGNTAVSELLTFRTGVDTKPPKISSIKTQTSIQGTGDDAAVQVVITWTTDEPATSQAAYSPGMAGSVYANTSKTDSRFVTTHMVVIDGLEPSSAYHFRVLSKDKAGNEGKSKDSLFLTDESKKPVLELIIAGLQRRIGWLFNIGG